tara:strand:+ start:19319 stop:20809 length:1491 start_codon:yes stop_codon:yes gene_type:complete
MDIGFDNYDHLHHFPLGLLYLASVLRQNNIEVKIVDLNNLYYIQNFKQQKEQSKICSIPDYIKSNIAWHFDDFKPDVVGIGCVFTGAFECAKVIAEKVKSLFPNIPIVIGGIHATIFSTEILKKHNCIDYVILGEGEVSFLELVKCLTDENRGSIDSIDGMAFRRDGNIIKNSKTKFMDNLDRLPFIDFSLVEIKNYKLDTSSWYSPKKIKIGLPFPVLSSRSCPCRCTFCSMWLVHGPKIRFRSYKHVVDELQHHYDQYGARYFSFVDDNLTFNKKRIIKICEEIIKRGLNIQFDTPNGVAINSLNRETIVAMVAAGLVKINLSPENGSEYIRRIAIGKKLKTEKIYEVFNLCAEHSHLYIGAYFIIGMPQETDETLKETYEMITKLPVDRISFSLATPYPGTELYEYCKKHGLLQYDHESSYDFKKEYLGSQRPYFKPHNLNEEDLIKFLEKCRNLMKERRMASDLPENYPLRHTDSKTSDPLSFAGIINERRD